MARHAQCMQNLFLKKHESSKNDGVGTPYTITVSPSSKKFLKKATNHFLLPMDSQSYQKN